MGMDTLTKVVAILAFVFSLLSFWITSMRASRVEKSNAYLQLEVNSTNVFKYEAEHSERIAYLRSSARPGIYPTDDYKCRQLAKNFYFQSLNIFEVCGRFRREGIIYPEVYASWVAWFWDILTDWYFQDIWESEIRSNYTREVRDVFDLGMDIMRSDLPDHAREIEFYRAVGKVVGCDKVSDWLDDLAEPARWDSANKRILRQRVPMGANSASQRDEDASTPAPQLTYSWHRGEHARKVAEFAARIIGAQASYISHGEIQTGLSIDGRNWIEGLEDRYALDFADPGERDMLIAWLPGERIAGIGIVAWHLGETVPHAEIEDMAVEPELRGSGIGAQIIDQLVERIRGSDAKWVFLQSGLENHRAHEFFKRHGFHETSHVFARRLD